MPKRNLKITAQEFRYEAYDLLYYWITDKVSELSEDADHIIMNGYQFSNERIAAATDGDTIQKGLVEALSKEITKLEKRWGIEKP